MSVGLDRRVDVVPVAASTGGGERPRPAAAPSPPTAVPWSARFRRAVLVVLGLQLLAMAAVSLVEYHRYALGVGFGTYSQAWTAIAHGRLDPVSSLIGKPFWRNDAELVLWPLSILYWVYPHPVDLLWVQDLALVATEYVAVSWMADVIGDVIGDAMTGRERRCRLLAFGCLAAVVADPFVYFTAAYDFHSEALSALFVVLAGRALWSGRHRRLWVVVPLGLATSGLSALYLAGVGVSGIVAGRRSRRAGAAVAGAALAWLVVVSVAGGAEFGYAHSLSGWYGYLVGPHQGPVTTLDVVRGALVHPLTALHMLSSRWTALADLLLAAGLVGMVWPWAWPVAVVVLVPSALNANAAFVSPQAAFQNWAALPLLSVASLSVAVRLLGRPDRRRLGVGCLGLWAAALVVLGVALFPRLPGDWVSVRPAASAALADIDRAVPARAEVIASWGVAGRFAWRTDVHGYGTGGAIAVDRHLVVFVIAPGQGIFGARPSAARSALAYVRARLDGTVLVHRGGVEAIAWRPGPGVSSVTLPVGR